MQVRVSLAQGLPPQLEDSARRQIEFKLSSLRPQVQQVNVAIGLEGRGATAEPLFSCSVTARTRKNRDLSVATRGRQAQICIADAASRISRSIARGASSRI